MKIIFDLGGRLVHWNVDPNVGAVLLQSLVQVLGPAEEGA